MKETPKAKRRRKSGDEFEKPKYSIKDKMRERREREDKKRGEGGKSRTANLTDCTVSFIILF